MVTLHGEGGKGEVWKSSISGLLSFLKPKFFLDTSLIKRQPTPTTERTGGHDRNHSDVRHGRGLQTLLDTDRLTVWAFFSLCLEYFAAAIASHCTLP